MTSYTQYNGSVSTTYRDFFLSQFDSGDYYLIFATETQYVCVYSEKKPETGSVIKFNDESTNVITVSKNYSSSSSPTISYTATSADITVVNPINIYSNVGVGTVYVSPSDTLYAYSRLRLCCGICLCIMIIVLAQQFLRRKWSKNG